MGIGDGECRFLAEKLSEHSYVNSLILEHNAIGKEGLKELSRYIEVSSTLKKLNLQWNKCGEGLQSLSKSMNNNPSCRLSSLDLRNNDIGPDQSLFICDILKNPCVRELNLNFNKLSDSGADTILKTLKSIDSCSVYKLDLIGNNISPGLIAGIKEAITGVASS